MESSSLVAIVAIILTLPLFLYSFLWKSRGSVRKEPPQAGGAWPIFGHLHLFSGSYGPPHLALADKYGPIFTMKFGVKKALVVRSSEMAKECLKTNDTVFSGRAKSLAFEILGSNYAFFPFSSYGYYFSQVRKMVMLELLSPHRVELVKHIRESEVNTAIKETYGRWRKGKKSSGKVVVEMKEWFGNINENVIFRMIIGKTFSEATKNYANNSRGNLIVRKIFKEFLVLQGAFVMSDGIPWLRWLDLAHLGGQKKAMRKISKEVDQVLRGWVEEHKQKRKIDGQVKVDDEHDFMDAMLSVLDGSKVTKDYYDADTISKYTALALLLAGGDVTTVTMTWDFELIPFGSGRRMCPGIALAIKIVPLSLASLLHGFDIITPRDETVDMSESIQLTNHKAHWA